MVWYGMVWYGRGAGAPVAESKEQKKKRDGLRDGGGVEKWRWYGNVMV